MSVYMIFSFAVVDQDKFAPYGKAVTPVIVRHGGEVLVADFAAKSLEGTAMQVNAVLRFPSEQEATAFYNNPDYAPLMKLMSDTTTDSAVLLAKGFVRPA